MYFLLFLISAIFFLERHFQFPPLIIRKHYFVSENMIFINKKKIQINLKIKIDIKFNVIFFNI